MLLDGVILLEGSDVVNLTLPSGTEFPSSPNIGEIFFNSTDNKVYVYYADVWSTIGGSTSNAVAVNSGTALPDVNAVVEGELFILTTTNKIYSAIGGSWVQLSNEQYTVRSGSSLPDVATLADGELFILSTTGKLYAKIAGALVQLSNESVVQFGTTLPNIANNPAGTLFVLTTTGKIYCSVAGAWVQLSNEASVSSGTTLPASNVSVAGSLFILTTTNKIHGFIGGSWVQLSENATTPTPNIYDIAVSVPGTIIADSTIAFFVTPRSFFIPSTLTGSIAAIGVNNGDASFVVYRNSTLVATIAFTGSSLTGTITPAISETFTFNGGSISYTGILFSAGDVFQIFAPSINVPESFAVTFKTEIPL